MLSRHGVQHRLFDANVEGLLHLFGRAQPFNRATDAWTKRAFKNRGKNLSAIQQPDLYHHLDRYTRTIKDIGRVLEKASSPETTVGLADYAQKGLSPVRSSDLLAASEKPEMNAFYPYFRDRLGKLLERDTPSAVGISLNYLSQALTAFSLIGFVRREHPGIRIIMGGGLVTSWEKGLNGKNPFAGLVDHMVFGQAKKNSSRSGHFRGRRCPADARLSFTAPGSLPVAGKDPSLQCVNRLLLEQVRLLP